MENLIWILPVLACPIGMFVMMWMMGKGMSSIGGGRDAERREPSLNELRAEHERLGSRIESLEQGNGDRASESDRTPA